MRWGGDFGRMGDGGIGEDAGRRGAGEGEMDERRGGRERSGEKGKMMDERIGEGERNGKEAWEECAKKYLFH